jgi:hypothetical protein
MVAGVCLSAALEAVGAGPPLSTSLPSPLARESLLLVALLVSLTGRSGMSSQVVPGLVKPT